MIKRADGQEGRQKCLKQKHRQNFFIIKVASVSSQLQGQVQQRKGDNLTLAHFKALTHTYLERA